MAGDEAAVVVSVVVAVFVNWQFRWRIADIALKGGIWEGRGECGIMMLERIRTMGDIDGDGDGDHRSVLPFYTLESSVKKNWSEGRGLG